MMYLSAGAPPVASQFGAFGRGQSWLAPMLSGIMRGAPSRPAAPQMRAGAMSPFRPMPGVPPVLILPPKVAPTTGARSAESTQIRRPLPQPGCGTGG